LKWTLRSLPIALAAAQTTPHNPPLAPQKDGRVSNARPTHCRNKGERDLTLGRVARLLRVLHLRRNSEMSVRKTKRSMAAWWRRREWADHGGGGRDARGEGAEGGSPSHGHSAARKHRGSGGGGGGLRDGETLGIRRSRGADGLADVVG